MKVNHTVALPVCEEQWKELQKASSEDQVLCELRKVIQEGWPKSRKDTPRQLQPYFDLRADLITEGELVFRGQQVVVPMAMRKEMMERTHASHIGIGGCLRKAREMPYWPRMSTELRDMVSKCDVCLKFRKTPTKEPLLSHEVGSRPWSKLGADLAEQDGR